MKISLTEISIKEVFDGYEDDAEEGVTAYGGKLNVRPAYQREFVYKDKQRDEVINTVYNDFPLNVMYWVKNPDDTYELLDGQQRTISICQYVNGDFSLNYKYFHNLTEEEKNQINDYKLMIYVCEGTDKEKLDWFKTINIAGEKLTPQELRNAIYTGEWLTDSKKHFSKTSCPAYNIASAYLKGSSIRQEYLEMAIKWIASRDAKDIEDYMAEHQHDTNCSELWMYFQNVINWVKTYFPTYRKEMKGLDWGIFYNLYNANTYDPKALETRIQELINDDEVQNNKGIYEFLLNGETNTSPLNLRQFPDKIARKVYEKQKGICPKCTSEGTTKAWDFEEMEADHIIPWIKGGKTTEDNCQMLCRHHNRTKSGK